MLERYRYDAEHTIGFALASGFTLLRTASRRATVARLMWLYGLFIGLVAWALT